MHDLTGRVHPILMHGHITFKYFLESNKEFGLPVCESIFRCLWPREHFKTKFSAPVQMFRHNCGTFLMLFGKPVKIKEKYFNDSIL